MELCCFGTQAIQWMDARPNLAGWFQGLLTVAALAVALWQSGQSARLERSKAAAAVRAAWHTTAAGQEFLRHLMEIYSPRDPELVAKFLTDKAPFNRIQRELGEIDIMHLPSATAVNAIRDARAAAHDGLNWLERSAATAADDPMWGVRNVADELQKSAATLDAEYRRLHQSWLRRRP